MTQKPSNVLKPTAIAPSDPCPCRRGSAQPLSYADCCAALHQGQHLANDAEQLMRSRYSAFYLHLTDYLLQSWHPQTRPAHLNGDDSPAWQRLQILHHEIINETQQKVHFRAFYLVQGQLDWLEEISDFEQVDGRWFYHSGNILN